MSDTKLKTLNPEERIHNYNEVVLGMNSEQALAEANRCLNCVNHPCVDGCPIHNRIPEFISKIKENKIDEAYEIIESKSTLPSICSRVCPSEIQCQAKCTRGYKEDPICINGLERYVCDNHTNKNITKQKSNNHSVAIIGAGPSGLSCAKKLALLGYDVTIFESFELPGGVLTYGIPEFRLPKKIVEDEINKIINLGVTINTNKKIESFIDLKKDYDALYISIGATESLFMNIKGEDLNGVFGANDFLLNANLHKEKMISLIKNKNVIVVGGGNVAMDVARSSVRLGAASTNIVYRRSLKEMPACKQELEQTLQEGVKLNILTNPVEILGQENVSGVRCIKMELGEPDEKGRRKPIEIKGSEFEIEADVVVMALSSKYNDMIKSQNIELNKYGYIETKQDMSTSVEGIFAGGDIVSGPATVAKAVEDGIKASTSIDKYIQSKI